MRHGKKINHLSRTHSHRAAMLSNMASSLIVHKRITTTLAKAKALREAAEILIHHFMLFSDEKITLDTKPKTPVEEFDENKFL